jgi:hypothetical protein
VPYTGEACGAQTEFREVRRQPRRGGLFIERPSQYTLFFVFQRRGGTADLMRPDCSARGSASARGTIAAPLKNKKGNAGVRLAAINRPPLRGLEAAASLGENQLRSMKACQDVGNGKV